MAANLGLFPLLLLQEKEAKLKTKGDFQDTQNDTMMVLNHPAQVKVLIRRKMRINTQQCSSGMERRFSISPVRRSSHSTTSLDVRNNNSTSSKPAKMVYVPATVTSLVMDKSNDNGCGESAAATTGIKRITVRRNVGAASPRSQSPSKANGNAANQQQQLSLSRNSSRKKDESPYRRNPLSEIESNSIAIPYSTNNYNNCRMQSRSNMEVEAEAKQHILLFSKHILETKCQQNCIGQGCLCELQE